MGAIMGAIILIKSQGASIMSMTGVALVDAP